MIIAEIGHNHNGDMEIAKNLIHKAKECGANIAKFQLYDIDKILPKTSPVYDDLAKGQLTKDQWFEIVDECNRVGIEFLASCFDAEKVGWCEKAGMMRYKIASRSIYDEALLEKVISTGKDIIISLGMVDERGIPKITAPVKVDYLYCIAKYPTPLADLHFDKVNFKQQYDGFSDHTLGIEASMAAIVKGARIIEKHFTLDRNMEGCDQRSSMEPDELKRLVTFAHQYEDMR